MSLLDQKRFFSEKDRSTIYLIYAGKCANCKRSLSDNFHIDHRIPHSKLGRTKINNAVALCGSCNLEKSNELVFDYAKRSWQITALNSTVDVAMKGVRDFVTNACPGAGKTRYAISFLQWALETEFADLVIYCTPSVELRDDVADSLEELTKFRLSKVIDGPAFERVIVDGVPNRVSGFSITYQTLVSRVGVVEALCQRHNVIFVCDEIHHAGLQRSWGDAVRQAANEAKFRLGLSGTPFRSDDNQIAFLNYEDSRGIPEYNFFYGQALAAGYVAPVQFIFRNAFIRFEDPRAGDQPVTLELREDYNEAEAIKLRATYADESGYSEAIMDQANTRLRSLYSEDPTAGGLVIASSIPHANRIARYIRSTLNETCEIVHSEQDNTDRIKNFKANLDRWIVSVGMISEGVDIPRLRVLVFLSAITTRLHFHQAIGRVVRLHYSDRPFIEQSGIIFLPPTPAFRELAQEFEDEILHVLDNEELDTFETNRLNRPTDNEPTELETFTALPSESWEDGGTFSGFEMTQDEIEAIRQEASRIKIPIFNAMPEGMQRQLIDEVKSLIEKNSEGN